jgi:hypothetical protein
MSQEASRKDFIAMKDRLLVAFELGWEKWRLGARGAVTPSDAAGMRIGSVRVREVGRDARRAAKGDRAAGPARACDNGRRLADALVEGEVGGKARDEGVIGAAVCRLCSAGGASC